MTSTIPAGGQRQHRSETLLHEAAFYAGEDDFVRQMSAFVLDGVHAGEPVLVMIPGRKIGPLRDALGTDGAGVRFGDMNEIGRNPGRIISRWRDFCAEHAVSGRLARGIGEPIWAGRSRQELVEAQRHEALINLALLDARAWVVCPYDTTSLDDDVIDEAYRSHPIVSNGATGGASDRYRSPSDVDRPFDDPLPDAPDAADPLSITLDDLSLMRHRLAARAIAFGIDDDHTAALVLAVNEVMSNGLVHGEGAVTMRTWTESEDFVCEIRDEGLISDALVGRQRPQLGDPSGYGLWIANELCDLVQLRSGDAGSAVRLHMARR